MANVKSRLKAPKSASTKKKKKGHKTKKSSTGPKTAPLKRNSTESNIVMKRPCSRLVMTPDQKIKFLLKNGHKLKERFIAKPPVNVKPIPEVIVESNPEPTVEPQGCSSKSQDSNLHVMTKTGRIKKKKHCNMKVVDSILKHELMIGNRRKAIQADDAPPVDAPSLAMTPLRVGVDNNNDIEITDQNKTSKDFSEDDVCKLSDTISTKSGDATDDENSSSSNEKSGSKSSKKEKKIAKPRPRHITLKNGVILKLEYFECDHCNRTFNRKCSLRRHMYTHLGLKPFQCPHCSKQLTTLYNMQVHVDRYHKPSDEETELYICNFCEKPYLVKENLKKHLETHINKGNSFKCIYCNRVFEHQILLMQHEKKHMVKGRHQCTLCSMSYRCRNLLYSHVKSHLKIKDFVCQYCGKEFLRPNSLKRHVEVSHGEARIVCPICKKKLKGHLTEHMRTHDKKRPHVCPECGQRFTQSTQLNVHRRSHTGDRPYLCRICKRFFSHSNALMLHIRRHTGEKPFPCAMCPMSFSQLPHMKTHMRKIHGKENPYKCPNCESFYKLKVELEVHEKSCIGAATVDKPVKGNRKKSKKGDDEIEVESAMSLTRMRFLLALLLTMIASSEKLKYLGFNKRLVDEILVESLEAMGKTPCKDITLTPAKRLKKNIEMFIIGTVPKNQMATFKKQNKSTEDILELLTTDKDK